MTKSKSLTNRVFNRLKYSTQKVFVLTKDLEDTGKSSATVNRHKQWEIKESFDVADILHIRGLMKDADVYKWEKKIKERISKGGICWVLYEDKIPISYMWTELNPFFIETIGTTLRLDDNTFAIYDIYTKEQYRKQGCYQFLLQQTENSMGKKGFCKCILWVMIHNQSAIVSHIRCGFATVIFEVSYTSCCGLILYKNNKVNYETQRLINER